MLMLIFVCGLVVGAAVTTAGFLWWGDSAMRRGELE